MVFRKTNKRTQIDMTPVVEVRMMIKTNDGDSNVNFFTVIEIPYDCTDDDEYENYFFSIVSDAVNDVLDRINKKINAGWAIVFYERDELFTLSFFKGKEEDRWKYQTLENYNDPTIH